MDKVSKCFQKNCSAEQNIEILHQKMLEAINNIGKQAICELKAIGRPTKALIEIAKAVVILFGKEYHSYNDFLKFFSNPWGTISMIKEINPKIPIEGYILDQIFSIIFIQDLNVDIGLNYANYYLFIWIKSYLAIQILIRENDFKYYS